MAKQELELFEVKTEEAASQGLGQELLKLKDQLDKQLTQAAGLEVSPKIKTKEIKDPQQFEALLKDYEKHTSKDKLTCLFNRQALFDKGVDYLRDIENSVEKEKSLTVMSLDVDFFKAYNSISHTFGDVALQKIGKVLLENTRESGFGVRLGGEEIFLLVEKHISMQEAQEKAEKIKQEIKQEMNELFKFADQTEGQKPGYTKGLLENNILTEDRNRSSFNEEMAKNSDFEEIFMQAQQDFDLDLQMDPADFVLYLKNKIEQTKDPQEKRKFQDMKDKLPFEIGTATMGMARVEFDGAGKISIEENTEIKMIFNKQGERYQDFVGRSFEELYQAIKKMPDKDKQVIILKKIRQRRFGKIVDSVISLAEEQKKLKRNSVKFSNYTIEQIDEKKEKKVEKKVAQKHVELSDGLEKLLKQHQGLIPDYLSTKYHELEQSFPQVSEQYDFIAETQKDYYFDSLTRAKNYEYLVQIVPEQLRQLKDQNQDFAMVSFDLDNLKAINESGGHRLGDVALMNLSMQMQQVINNLHKNKELKKFPQIIEKIKDTKMEPSVIRVTGGEEFLLTFPGLNADEAHLIFNIIKDKVEKQTRRLLEKELKKNKGIEDYIEQKLRRSGVEKEKYATLTAGIVSLKEMEADGWQIDEDGWMNAGLMRQIADHISERLKEEVYPDGTTGRAHTWEYDTYKIIKKADKAIEEKQLLQIENNALKTENEKLVAELESLRDQLKKEKEKSQISRLREELKAKI